MKNFLALFAIAALLVGTSGCGCCRGLFGKSSAPFAAPVYSQCAPSCGATCSADPSCGDGCGTGTPVTYGYGGGSSYAPMTFPTGSGAYGQ